MLSKPYLVTVSEALADVTGVTVIAFASQGAKEYTRDAYWVPATAEVRAELGTSWFRVRGELLRALSEAADDSKLTEIVERPESVGELVPAVRRAVRRESS